MSLSAESGIWLIQWRLKPFVPTQPSAAQRNWGTRSNAKAPRADRAWLARFGAIALQSGRHEIRNRHGARDLSWRSGIARKAVAEGSPRGREGWPTMDAQGTRVMSDRNQRSRALLLGATVIVMQLMSIALFAGGLWLVMLGGSIYYLVAGVVLAAKSWLLMRRSAAALWVYAAMLLGTMAWAIWEVGFDFWSLAPRGDILVPLGVWLLFPFIVSHLSPGWRNARRALVLALLASAVVLVISLSADRFAIAGKLPQANAITDLTESPAKVDWTAYGSTGA